jgi:hypothetical protein
MPQRLKVLYLPLESVAPRWQEEVVKAVTPHHDLMIYDRTQPFPAMET